MELKMNKELESKLWKAAEALRGNISSENYMYIVIGILFLKHISDKYKSQIEKYEKENNRKLSENQKKDLDILSLAGISFVVPKKAKWEYISKYATSAEIGAIIDNAFEQIEEKNDALRGLFEKNYNREELDQRKLGQVVSEFSNIDLKKFGEDVIGRTYEYFLGQFFLKQGQKGGEFYTPDSIVKLIVELINPTEGKIYDPAAGTGGMLVQARNHIIKNGGNPNNLVAYGQEYQNKTWKLSRINLLLHGFPVENIKLGHKSDDTFSNDLHTNEKFDFILANPPFNQKMWGLESLLDDKRWKWGTPPKGNANYAWLSHMMFKLNNSGKGATVLANISMSSLRKDELAIRKKWVETNMVEAIITLPNKLFYTTGIPATIWVFSKNKTNNKITMINASNFEGKMQSKKLRILLESDITKIKNVFNKSKTQDVEEVGFAKSVSIKELEKKDYSFVPGRYVGFAEEIIDKKQIKKEIKETSKELKKLFTKFNELLPKVEKSIEKALNFENEE